MLRVFVKLRGEWIPTDSAANSAEALAEAVAAWRALGYRHVRVQ